MTDLLSIRRDISGYRALLRTEFSDAGRQLISDLLLQARAEEATTESAVRGEVHAVRDSNRA